MHSIAATRNNPFFFNDADYEAFEQIIVEGLEKFPIVLLAYNWMNRASFDQLGRTGQCSVDGEGTRSFDAKRVAKRAFRQRAMDRIHHRALRT